MLRRSHNVAAAGAGRQKLEEERDVLRDPSDRVAWVHGQELVQWREERSLIFQSPGHVPNSAHSLLELCHGYHVLRPPHKPLGPSLRDSELVGPVLKNSYHVSTSGLSPGERYTCARRKQRVPVDSILPCFQMEIVRNQ